MEDQMKIKEADIDQVPGYCICDQVGIKNLQVF